VSKGLEYLIRAIPEVIRKIPEVQFLLIIGNEPRERRMEIIKMVQNLDIKNSVHIIPPQKPQDLRAFIASVSLAVVPSLAEGF